METSYQMVKERKMVNFMLGETNVKMKWSKCLEHGTKKKSESPTGFEPMTSKTPGGRSIHLSYEELMESEAIY